MTQPSINFLLLTVSEICPRKDFKGQGHYSKVKGQIRVTPRYWAHTRSKQSPYQVSNSYTLWFPRYSPDAIISSRSLWLIKRSNQGRLESQSRSHNDLAYLHPPAKDHTKYQLPTLHSFSDMAQSRFSNSNSLQ